ncbi:MAG: cephalosporin hydroxylase family protein [Gammaproteobacteria bacterium]|jgi:cephalosporin hydroxylase|nr:cephalosporin hydroxylase family protein [Gammaproteobacteria bacterium]
MHNYDPRVEYHKWYYDTEVWEGVRFHGVVTNKSVSDMWNYQEILFELKPALIVEFGTRFGGSALYFSVIGRSINPQLAVLSVDVSHAEVDPRVGEDPAIELMSCSSSAPEVAARIRKLRASKPGSVFFILDSDHRKAHVLAELTLLRDVVHSGDYVVVEDGNINGHPVLPQWGEGPTEALEEYFRMYPQDYERDTVREQKFGFTFAPGGFLRKR